MCARLSFMFGGHFISITIRPGGPAIAVDTANLVDVRNLFPNDERIEAVDPMAVDRQLANLRTAADRIRTRLRGAFLPAGAPRPAPQAFNLTVQCQEGQSRSPRAVAAFLVTFCGFSVDAAMQLLRTAYSDPNRDGCNQVLREALVEGWLERYFGSAHRRA